MLQESTGKYRRQEALCQYFVQKMGMELEFHCLFLCETVSPGGYYAILCGL